MQLLYSISLSPRKHRLRIPYKETVKVSAVNEPLMRRSFGAQVLGEFGDDRTRFSGPKSRKNYAGTSPVTKASGHSRIVLARFARNRRLGNACDQWASAP